MDLTPTDNLIITLSKVAVSALGLGLEMQLGFGKDGVLPVPSNQKTYIIFLESINQLQKLLHAYVNQIKTTKRTDKVVDDDISGIIKNLVTQMNTLTSETHLLSSHPIWRGMETRFRRDVINQLTLALNIDPSYLGLVETSPPSLMPIPQNETNESDDISVMLTSMLKMTELFT